MIATAVKVPALLSPTVSALCTVADGLRGIAARCPRCAGTGSVRALFVAHTLTDDERALSRHYVDPARRARLRRNPTVDPTPRGAGVLSTPCRECHDLRQLIEIAEAAL